MRETSPAEAEERQLQALVKKLRLEVRPLVRADDSLDPEIFWPLKKSELQAEYLSDDYLSLMFCMNYASELCYVGDDGQWIIWDGSCWQRDNKGAVFLKVREFCRRLADEINNPKLGRRICSKNVINTVEELSRRDERIAVCAADLDSDVWILPTSKGTVDLKTGRLRLSNRSELCTKSASVAPGGSCPLWLDFLRIVTADDEEMQGYLKRLAGYILTGETREHAVFFLYGFDEWQDNVHRDDTKYTRRLRDHCPASFTYGQKDRSDPGRHCKAERSATSRGDRNGKRSGL
jgi:hypothetical protein